MRDERQRAFAASRGARTGSRRQRLPGRNRGPARNHAALYGRIRRSSRGWQPGGHRRAPRQPGGRLAILSRSLWPAPARACRPHLRHPGYFTLRRARALRPDPQGFLDAAGHGRRRYPPGGLAGRARGPGRGHGGLLLFVRAHGRVPGGLPPTHARTGREDSAHPLRSFRAESLAAAATPRTAMACAASSMPWANCRRMEGNQPAVGAGRGYGAHGLALWRRLSRPSPIRA